MTECRIHHSGFCRSYSRQRWDGTGRPGAQPETVLIAAALPRARRLAAVVRPVGRPAATDGEVRAAIAGRSGEASPTLVRQLAEGNRRMAIESTTCEWSHVATRS
jgi:hypothetical protein